MAPRFVPAHVRSAIDIVETENERTTAERDAFATFADYLSGLDVSSIELHDVDPQYSPAQALVAPERTRHADSQLARVRDTYRETVMGVPHYQEDYGDSLLGSLAEEFGPEITAAVTTTDQLTAPLRNRLIEATHEARESRHALLQGLKHEHSALEAADETLTRLGADLDGVLSAQSFDSWSDERLTLTETVFTHASKNAISSRPTARTLSTNSGFPALTTSISNSPSISTNHCQ